MPFTFAHPAVVLPLALLPRRWISVTGLVVGSMAPDFEKFLKMAPGNTISHAWEGIFWFNLPLGIALAFLFHTIVRDPLIHNLPVLLKKRFIRFSNFSWYPYFKKNYLTIAFSVVIGAASHIGVDSITHRKGLGVQLLGFLSEGVAVGERTLPLYYLLDLLGSLLGSLLVLGVVLWLPVSKGNAQGCRKWWLYWPVVVAIGVPVIMLRALLSPDSHAYWNMIIATISATMMGVTVSSFIVKYSSK